MSAIDKASGQALAMLTGRPQPTAANPVIEDLSIFKDGDCGLVKLVVVACWPGKVGIPEHDQAEAEMRKISAAAEDAYNRCPELAKANQLAKQAAELREQLTASQGKVAGLEQRRQQAIWEGTPTLAIGNDLTSAKQAAFHQQDELSLVETLLKKAEQESEAARKRIWREVRQARAKEIDGKLAKLLPALIDKLRPMVSEPCKLSFERELLRRQLDGR